MDNFIPKDIHNLKLKFWGVTAGMAAVIRIGKLMINSCMGVHTCPMQG